MVRMPTQKHNHPGADRPLGAERLWDYADVAEYLRLAEVTVRKMVRRRELPVIRIGRRVLFDPSDIRSWLQTRKERAA